MHAPKPTSSPKALCCVSYSAIHVKTLYVVGLRNSLQSPPSLSLEIFGDLTLSCPLGRYPSFSSLHRHPPPPPCFPKAVSGGPGDQEPNAVDSAIPTTPSLADRLPSPIAAGSDENPGDDAGMTAPPPSASAVAETAAGPLASRADEPGSALPTVPAVSAAAAGIGGAEAEQPSADEGGVSAADLVSGSVLAVSEEAGAVSGSDAPSGVPPLAVDVAGELLLW